MKNRLKEFRTIYDTTQEELAKNLGVSRQRILDIEKDKYDPSLKLTIKIVKFFNIPIEELFVSDEKEIKYEAKN